MYEDSLTDSSFHYDELLGVFPEPTARLSSSSSSSFSSVPWWDVLDSGKTEEDHNNDNNNYSADGTETEAYNYMDFMKGGSEVWGDHDDDNLLNHLNTSDSDFQQPMIIVDEQQPLQSSTVLQPQKRESAEDQAMVFMEWLKSNKGSFSAEDLRKVLTLKKSTIESAIQRFGGGKKGMKRLLALILEWVQKSRDHDQGKRMRTPKYPRQSLGINSSPRPHPYITDQNGIIYIGHSPPADQNIPHLTLPQSPQFSNFAGKGTTTTVEAGTKISSMVDQYTNESIIDFTNPYKHTSGYSCSPSHYAMPSPTKEARWARMARQKHFILGHKHNQSHHGNHQQIDGQNSIEYQHAMLIGTNRENCMESPSSTSEDELANWVYWP